MTLKLYAIYLGLCSMIAFLWYVIDKRRAIKGKWRISEANLLGISFVGGSVGGLLAMQLVRHKTKHWYFYAVNLLGLAWQVALLVFLIKNPSWLF